MPRNCTPSLVYRLATGVTVVYSGAIPPPNSCVIKLFWTPEIVK